MSKWLSTAHWVLKLSYVAIGYNVRLLKIISLASISYIENASFARNGVEYVWISHFQILRRLPATGYF